MKNLEEPIYEVSDGGDDQASDGLPLNEADVMVPPIFIKPVGEGGWNSEMESQRDESDISIGEVSFVC